MTRWPSVSGTPGEAEFSERLHALLAQTPYFQDHPDQLLTFDSHGDPMTRNVAALVRGCGRETIVLAGHFDTVSIDNYGTLAPLAIEPEGLTKALVAELSARPRNPAEEKALADLLGGDFIAGRGLLDMKSGLAAGIAAMERFAALPAPVGNILFIATPDEEVLSRGMRSVRDALPALAERFGLDIVGGINLDASSCERNGEEGRAVYLGSVGKFLPFAFVVGRPTHAGYPFDGISAHRIAAEIVRAIDTNPALCDEAFGETSPAPVVLEVKDLRESYDVTTPDRVWLACNWLTHRRTAAGLFEEFAAIVGNAMAAALGAQAENRSKSTGDSAPSHAPAGRVLAYSELVAIARERGGETAIERVRNIERTLSGGDNPLAITREIVSAMVTEAGIVGPAVIVGLSSLHYPLVHLDRQGAAGRAMQEILASVMERVAARHDTTIKFKQIFAGISDMSFFGHAPDASETDVLAVNTPAAVFSDTPPAGSLSFPVVNIGPWGRDYHQKWERVHAPYTFTVLPDLVFEAAVACLQALRAR
ncbi:M20/M25/M40 family metallo-hydrolase [Sinorhizobium sp. BG8]|nr:M20/M25/M40 family metallo-hydrolase [Sinorhizobium sp. BG8]